MRRVFISLEVLKVFLYYSIKYWYIYFLLPPILYVLSYFSLLIFKDTRETRIALIVLFVLFQLPLFFIWFKVLKKLTRNGRKIAIMFFLLIHLSIFILMLENIDFFKEYIEKYY